MINGLNNPQMQQALQQIMQSRKMQGNSPLDTNMQPMQNATTPQLGQPSFDSADFKKSVQGISDLMGYGNDSTFGMGQIPQGGANPMKAAGNMMGDNFLQNSMAPMAEAAAPASGAAGSAAGSALGSLAGSAGSSATGAASTGIMDSLWAAIWSLI